MAKIDSKQRAQQANLYKIHSLASVSRENKNAFPHTCGPNCLHKLMQLSLTDVLLIVARRPSLD